MPDSGADPGMGGGTAQSTGLSLASKDTVPVGFPLLVKAVNGTSPGGPSVVFTLVSGPGTLRFPTPEDVVYQSSRLAGPS